MQPELLSEGKLVHPSDGRGNVNEATVICEGVSASSLPSEAQNDVLSFMEAGVFSPAIHVVDQFLANMMVVLSSQDLGEGVTYK